MKPAFGYYGGKQFLAKHIVPMIPKHRLYVEPFCGGAALFFAKPKSEIEVLNDELEVIVNFFRVLRNTPDDLIRLLQVTPYSRVEYEDSVLVCENDSEIERARKFFVNIVQSFNHKINGGWSYSRTNVSVGLWKSAMNQLYQCADRLTDAILEHKDALDVIKIFDSPDTFFYLDPPYPNTDQGHYGGYTEADFYNLIDLLTSIKGKFILSNYKFNTPFEFVSHNVVTSATKSTEIRSNLRTEYLYFNFKARKQMNLF